MELREDYEEITGLDTEVVAVSTDNLRGAGYVLEELELDFPVLYDPEATVARAYGVYNLLNDRLATPSTFVLDKSGEVRWKYIGDSRSDRPPNRQIIDELRKLG